MVVVGVSASSQEKSSQENDKEKIPEKSEKLGFRGAKNTHTHTQTHTHTHTMQRCKFIILRAEQSTQSAASQRAPHLRFASSLRRASGSVFTPYPPRDQGLHTLAGLSTRGVILCLGLSLHGVILAVWSCQVVHTFR